MFWPITAMQITQHTVEQVVAWAAGTPTIAGFSTLSTDYLLHI
jgi:hypothetical protein